MLSQISHSFRHGFNFSLGAALHQTFRKVDYPIHLHSGLEVREFRVNMK